MDAENPLAKLAQLMLRSAVTLEKTTLRIADMQYFDADPDRRPGKSGQGNRPSARTSSLFLVGAKVTERIWLLREAFRPNGDEVICLALYSLTEKMHANSIRSMRNTFANA